MGLATAKELRDILILDNDFEVRNWNMKWEYFDDSDDAEENAPIDLLNGVFYKTENGKHYTLS